MRSNYIITQLVNYGDENLQVERAVATLQVECQPLYTAFCLKTQD